MRYAIFLYGFLYGRSDHLDERSFQNGIAKISVGPKSSAQILSDELSLKDFGTFSVEVVSSTANQLELRVVPK